MRIELILFEYTYTWCLLQANVEMYINVLRSTRNVPLDFRSTFDHLHSLDL